MAQEVKGCLRMCWIVSRKLQFQGQNFGVGRHFGFLGQLKDSKKLVYVDHSKKENDTKPMLSEQKENESFLKFCERAELPDSCVLQFVPRNEVDWATAWDKIKDMKYQIPKQMCGKPVSELMKIYLDEKIDVIKMKEYVGFTDMFDKVAKNNKNVQAFPEETPTIKLVEKELEKANDEKANDKK